MQASMDRDTLHDAAQLFNIDSNNPISPSNFSGWFDSPTTRKVRQNRRNVKSTFNEATTRAAMIGKAQREDPGPDTEILRAPTTHPLNEFNDVEGIMITSNRKRAVHCLPRNIRQCAVSSGWLHEGANTFIWRVIVESDLTTLDQIYVGITESSGFQHRGRTFGVNLFGHSIFGTNPMDPTSQAAVCTAPGTVPITSTIHVKVNAKKKTVTFKVIDGRKTIWSVSKSITTWKSIRLWASTKSLGDAVTIF
jgi:hypothetical protein